MPFERVHHGRGFGVDRLITGPLDNNVYIVTDDETSASLIVDAADDAPMILEAVGDRTVVAIATTHGHWDHHGAAAAVAEGLGVPVLLHGADRAITDLVADPLEPGDLPVGSTSVQVVHTPGHTPGSVCLLVGDVALTGDTLFPGGPGATRFPYSDFDQIIDSIRRELFSLPESTLVLPGHGAPTSIGTERPQLQDWIDRRW